jgi:atrophin-1 interacting protein 3 (BAI1-associated protein 1)
VLVFVNGTCVLGFTHHDMVTMFQSIATGEVVSLEVCRGYPLPFDPDDPNTEIVTTVAVTSPEQGDWASELERQRQQGQPDVQSMPDLTAGPPSNSVGQRRPGSADLLGSDFEREEFSAAGGDPEGELSTIPIVRGGMGFGFTIADSGRGQKVKKILDRPRCKSLQEGDVLVRINSVDVRGMSHGDVVQVLKDCPRDQEAEICVRRGPGSSLSPTSPSKASSKYKRDGSSGLRPKSGFLFRSKTPTAELYSTQEKERVPNRPKTPLVDTRNLQQGGRSKTPTSLRPQDNPAPFQRGDPSRASLGGAYANHQPPFSAGYGNLPDAMAGLNLQQGNEGGGEATYYNQQAYGTPMGQDGYPGGYQPDSSAGYNGYEYGNGDYAHQAGLLPSPGKTYQQNGGQPQYSNFNGYGNYDGGTTGGGAGGPGYGYSPGGYRAGSLPRGSSVSSNNGGRKESTSFEHSEPLPGNLTRWPRPERRPTADCVELTVTLHRHDSGFGFRIVGGTEEGSQVSIGHIVPGGAADVDGRLFSGDEIVAVDGMPVLNTSHHQVVGYMGQAASTGRVTLTVRRRIYQGMKLTNFYNYLSFNCFTVCTRFALPVF